MTKQKTAPTTQYNIFWETKETLDKWNSCPLTEWDDDKGGRWAMLVGHLGFEFGSGSPASMSLPGWNNSDLD